MITSAIPAYVDLTLATLDYVEGRFIESRDDNYVHDPLDSFKGNLEKIEEVKRFGSYPITVYREEAQRLLRAAKDLENYRIEEWELVERLDDIRALVLDDASLPRPVLAAYAAAFGWQAEAGLWSGVPALAFLLYFGPVEAFPIAVRTSDIELKKHPS